MLSSGEKIFMALATGESLLGILANGFIVLVNCIDCVKSKKLPPSDLILSSLAISRIGLSCAIIWNIYLILVTFDVPTHIRIIDVFLVMSYNSNIWFATILSIFYFLKIANFSNPLFLWMKWRIDRMVFMLLWGPFIISLAIIFPMMERMRHYYSSIFSGGKERNVSQEVQVNKRMFLMLQVLFGFLSLIPFILTTVSFCLLILSLWRHTQRMQLNATGSRDPSTKAHVQAMKTVSSFLILFLLYHMSFFLNYWNRSEAKSKLTSMLGMSIMLLYPIGHSMILILWNSKLKQASLWVWQQALLWLRKGKP
ncbi:taste receptor type 2 member 7-like [Trichosurus vulpecula]|uniref:taste receptor type 2 member 7-like n=1 Tax=Trichosurus vulpecula TaxID=9337 RepID=UPI00186AF1AE|nr:taste receptor type 2 member 7-like [Trichosurus vulpecula]